MVEWGTDDEIARNGDYTYRLELDLRIGEDADEDEAASRRLHNLGYAPHASMIGAVRGFQRDYALPVTGTLDGATRARLTEVHDTQKSGGAV